MSLADERIGLTKTMNNGMKATITGYRNVSDIDVKYEDGVLCEHVSWESFRYGGTKRPLNRVGTRKKMNCGLECEIIRYGGFDDIDVRFENGVVRTGCKFSSFDKGRIAIKGRMPKEDKIGYTKEMNCGMSAVCIRYNNYNDIDIRFDDGTVVNTNWDSFMYGTSKHSKVGVVRFNMHEANKKKWLGKTKVMPCGMQCKITAFRTCSDMDVTFEDGTVVTGVSTEQFKYGIGNPSQYANNRIGMVRTMNCGMQCKVIAYRGSSDIDVMFANGTVKSNRTWQEFMSGRISEKLNYKPTRNKARVKYLGMRRVMNCGMLCTIVDYNNYNSITVRFEDGLIKTGMSVSKFIKGSISHKGGYYE